MSKMATQKMRSNNNNGYLIHVIRSNSSDYIFGFYSTCTGIEKGGIRTCNEIKDILIQYPSITKISLIGSSLGGLYIREVVKQLYNDSNKSLCIKNRCLIPMNFITLATPHLGVANKIHPIMVKLARIAYNCCLLPRTITDFLTFGKNPKLKQMAKNHKYLKPLELFSNKVIYANSINDNRVSVSSGLILPSYEYKNEEDIMQETYLEDIEYSRSNKQCIIRPFSRYLHKDNDLWYSDFMDDSMKWNRFVVSINTGLTSKIIAHELLSHPNESFHQCQPILQHLSRQFLW